MKKRRSKSWAMAYCGMAAALCVALMLLGTIIPIAMFIAPAVASFLIATVCMECGITMAWTAYAAVSLLGLLFVPDKEIALIFTVLLGYYPLVKPRFDRIRPRALQLVCKLLLCNGAVLAMYGLLLVLGCGEAETEQVKQALLEELSHIGRAPLPLCENLAMPRQDAVRRVECFDTVQAKLCMLFTLGVPMRPDQMAAVRLAMALYGGSVTSRLFLNVRERDHLCYYCSSSFQSFTGSMAVNSGVEHADAARAEKAILKELDDLRSGPITAEELEDCRRSLLSGMAGIEDTLGGIETWYYMEVLRGGPVQTPDDARAALQAVTEEDVRTVLRQLTLSVSYLLTREEESAHA